MPRGATASSQLGWLPGLLAASLLFVAFASWTGISAATPGAAAGTAEARCLAAVEGEEDGEARRVACAAAAAEEEEDLVSWLQGMLTPRAAAPAPAPESGAVLAVKAAGADGSAAATGTRPPPPNPAGLTADDKEMITDDFGGPFYDGTHGSPHNGGHEGSGPDAGATTGAPAPVPTPAPPAATLPPLGPGAAERRPAAMLATATLFGIAAFVLIVVCAVHPMAVVGREGRVFIGHSQVSRRLAMALISNTVSSLCACLLLFAAHSSWLRFATEEQRSEYKIIHSFGVVLALYLLLQFLLFSFRGHWWTLDAIGTVGGYAVGLAFADVLVSMSRLAFAQEAASGYILVAMGATIFFAVALSFLSHCREQVHTQLFPRISGVFHNEGWEEWRAQGKESDVVAASVSMAYVVYQLVSFGVVGTLRAETVAGYSAPTDDKRELLQVLCWAGFLAGIAVVLIFTMNRNEHHMHSEGGRTSMLIEHAGQGALLMAYAWCACAGVQAGLHLSGAPNHILSTLLRAPWVFAGGANSEGYLVGSAVLIALLTSFAVLLVGLVLVAILEIHGGQWELQPLLSGLGFIVGRSWAICFYLSAAALTDVWVYGFRCSLGLCLGLAFMLFVVHRLYIVTHTAHKPWVLARLAKAAEIVEDKVHSFVQPMQSRIPGLRR